MDCFSGDTESSFFSKWNVDNQHMTYALAIKKECASEVLDKVNNAYVIDTITKATVTVEFEDHST